MDRRDLVLFALAAGGENATFFPVQVQKLLFLIDRRASKFVSDLHSFNFKPYDYGPFDREVYDVLGALSREKMVEIDRSGRYRKYILTKQGYEKGSEKLKQLPDNIEAFVKETANWVRRLTFQQLVSAIYKAYPDMKTKSIFR